MEILAVHELDEVGCEVRELVGGVVGAVPVIPGVWKVDVVARAYFWVLGEVVEIFGGSEQAVEEDPCASLG